jgi:hypothetical protein
MNWKEWFKNPPNCYSIVEEERYRAFEARILATRFPTAEDVTVLENLNDEPCKCSMCKEKAILAPEKITMENTFCVCGHSHVSNSTFKQKCDVQGCGCISYVELSDKEQPHDTKAWDYLDDPKSLIDGNGDIRPDVYQVLLDNRKELLLKDNSHGSMTGETYAERVAKEPKFTEQDMLSFGKYCEGDQFVDEEFTRSQLMAWEGFRKK